MAACRWSRSVVNTSWRRLIACEASFSEVDKHTHVVVVGEVVPLEGVHVERADDGFLEAQPEASRRSHLETRFEAWMSAHFGSGGSLSFTATTW